MSNITADRNTLNAILATADLALADQVTSGRVHWRGLVDLSKAPVMGDTWDRRGIHLLISSAQAEFEEATGHRLPHNTSNWGSWLSHAWDRKHPRPSGHRGLVDKPANQAIGLAMGEALKAPSLWSPETEPCEPMLAPTDGSDPVEEAAKFAGFLRHAPEFRFLTRVITKTTSVRGIGSPRTSTNLGRVAERWTPGAAERHLRKVAARANEILRPHGLRVSYEGLGAALESGPRKVGKAAVWAAAATLRGDTWCRTYRQARQDLARLSKRPTEAVKIGDLVVSPTILEKYRPKRRANGWTVTRPDGAVAEVTHGDFYWCEAKGWQYAWTSEKAAEAAFTK